MIPPIIPPFAPELRPLEGLDVGVGVGVEVDAVVLVECEALEVVFGEDLEFAGGDVANAPIPVRIGLPTTT